MYTHTIDMKEPIKLNDFEAEVVSTVAHLMAHDLDAYGVPIAEAIETARKKPLNSGQLYASLARLTERGVLTVKELPPKRERGGRSKRTYELTALGRRSLTEYVRRVRWVLEKVPQFGGA
jgi:PadR family transcriptional regulator PadR